MRFDIRGFQDEAVGAACTTRNIARPSRSDVVNNDGMLLTNTENSGFKTTRPAWYSLT
jgi:hypothetical protein